MCPLPKYTGVEWENTPTNTEGKKKEKKRDQCPNAVVERLKTEIKGAGI